MIKDSMKILVIDDSATIRRLADSFLSPAGFEVSLAANAEEGLSLTREIQPDLILLDVRMPKLDGFAVCARIRQRVDGGEVPIVMVTGLEDIVSIEQSYQAGATDFITKPVVWSILSHRVRYLLRAAAVNLVDVLPQRRREQPGCQTVVRCIRRSRRCPVADKMAERCKKRRDR